jgi:hypothetical protein
MSANQDLGGIQLISFEKRRLLTLAPIPKNRFVFF